MRGLTGKAGADHRRRDGIGRAAALRFAEEGASVAVNFIGDPEPAEQLIEELAALCPTGEHLLAPADIADEDAVDSLFAGVEQAWGGLDVLVGNAGIKVVHEPHEVHPRRLRPRHGGQSPRRLPLRPGRRPAPPRFRPAPARS